MTLAPPAPQLEQDEEQGVRGPRTYRIAELFFVLLAVAISAGAYVLVGLGTSDTIPANVYEYSAWLAALGIGLHIITWWRAKYADPVIVPIAVLLNGLGLAMIFRIDIAKNTHVANTQLIWMTLGCILAALVIVFLRDHRILRRWIYISGLGAIVLLLLPLLPGLGTTVNGARIWIHLGPFSLQPGEIAKLLLAVFFAGYLVNYRDQLALAGPKVLGVRLPRLRDTGPIAIAWLASIGILIFQRDLGTSLLFFGLFVAMLYVATGVRSWIFIGMTLFAAGAYAAYLLFDHVQQRVNGWLHALDPAVFNEPVGGSYQLVQGMFGMANGGLFGSGLGEGRPQTVPFANSDFIFASMGEEVGLVGIFAILMLYLIFFERGMKTGLMLRDGFGTLLAVGLSFTFAWQTFIVVGGVTRTIPLTGLTTPFMAAGGSSLIANWIIVGLLLRLSDSARRPVTEIPTGVLPAIRDEDKPQRPAHSAHAAEAPTGAAAAAAGPGGAPDDSSTAGFSSSGSTVAGRRRPRGKNVVAPPAPDANAATAHGEDETSVLAAARSADEPASASGAAGNGSRDREDAAPEPPAAQPNAHDLPQRPAQPPTAGQNIPDDRDSNTGNRPQNGGDEQ